MSASANASDRTDHVPGATAIRLGIAALFIEGGLWSVIRFLSLVYVLSGEANLGPSHQTPGWTRLLFLVSSAAVASILFLAAGGLRNGSGVPARVAQVLAVIVNGVVLSRGLVGVIHFSGAEAVVVSLFVVSLGACSLVALAVDLEHAFVSRGSAN